MVKLSQFRHPTRFFMKEKDKNVGGGNNMNNFNGGGDGEKKKEKDPSKIQDRIMTLSELENTESDDDGITEFVDITIREKADAFITRLREGWRLEKINTLVKRRKLKDKRDLGGGDDDNNGGGGGKNNKKGSDRDGDGNGDKYKSDRDGDGGGQMKGKNMDFRGKALYGYKCGYHAGNEHEYQVGQLQCAQEVQSSEPKCWFYHPIMIS